MTGVSPEIYERAKAYAEGRLPVADLLSPTSEVVSTAPRPQPEEPPEAEDLEEAEEQEEPEEIP